MELDQNLLSKKRIVIIGDPILDKYISGETSRISPEAPVPIVNVIKSLKKLGGAGNVALNLKSLGANPILCSVIGNDENGKDLLHTYFDSTGIKTQEGKMKDGKKEGERILYYESGQLKDKINYKDGALEGERLEYFENGQLKEKVIYKDGKKEGEGLWYYENGQLEEKVNYKEGVKNGEWLNYYDNGQLVRTRIYKDGKLIETITP